MASATAEGIREVAEAIRTDGGMEAVQLRVAEQYVDAVRQSAQKSEHRWSCRRIVSDVAGMIAAAMKVFGSVPTTIPTRAAVPPPPPRG